ncbi:MAG: hypothetical protein J5882_04160, partial [Bacteroidales bacterium]|nr:hypothetical protein [Bacteroidales bacterium]
MKKLLLLLFVTIVCSTSYAQKGHYFYATLGGGFHHFDFYPDFLFFDEVCDEYTWNICKGYTFNLGWQYCVSKSFGYSAGFNLCSYGEVWNLESDVNSDVYFNNYDESLRQTVLEIPLGIIFQPSLGRSVHLLIGLNGYYSIMLAQKWQGTGSIVYQNNTFSNPSGDTQFRKSEVGIGSDLQLCIALDRYRTKEIVIGAYGRYGLSHIKSKLQVKSLVDPQTLEYNSITSIKVTSIEFSNRHRCIGLLMGFRYYLDMRAIKQKKKNKTKTTDN